MNAAAPRFLYDPTAPGFLANPYPAYAQLREIDPVHWSAGHGEWILTRHAEVRGALRDAILQPFDLGSIVAQNLGHDPAFPAVQAVARTMLVTRSDRGHGTARRFLVRVLNAQPLAAVAPLVETIARELFAAAQQRVQADLVAEFADVLPLRVITALLGLPAVDAPFLAECCDGVAVALLNRSTLPTEFRELNSRIATGLDYLHAEIRDRRARPRDDGLTRMVQLAPEDLPADDRELAAHAYFLFMASTDTTSAFLAGGFAALLEHEAERARWQRGEVDGAMAVEELLRFVSPLQMTPRVATAPTEIGGRKLQAGERAMLVLAAANRDPAAFSDPDRLNFARGGPPHLSFGDGAHSCLGAALARLEGETAFAAVARDPHLRRAAGEFAWLAHDKLRKPARVPVEFR